MAELRDLYDVNSVKTDKNISQGRTNTKWILSYGGNGGN